MKIQTVEYRRLVTHGTYENTTIGLVAELGTGETPEIVLRHLQEWVNKQLSNVTSVPTERLEVRHEVYKLQREKQDLQREVEAARQSWEKSKKILEAHGVPLSWADEVFRDMPF